MAATRTLTHLQRLEAESIHILREVVAEAERPVMLYSVGKDSAVMLHLARKAFYPSPPPFPLLHVDTTWKFKAMYELRDRAARDAGMELLVYRNPEAQARGINPFDHGPLHTDMWKTEGLKQALDKYGFDAAFGGARRDEEKSRAKERIVLLPLRQPPLGPQEPAAGALEPVQRPQGQGREHPGVPDLQLDRARHLAVHPPERHRDRAPLLRRAAPDLVRDGQLFMVDDERLEPVMGRRPEITERSIRFRTLGCFPLTGAVESDGLDPARGDPGDAAHHHLRAAGPGDRQGRRRRFHGEEEAGGLLLMAEDATLAQSTASRTPRPPPSTRPTADRPGHRRLPGASPA